MSDFTRCISALNKAAGRELSPEDVQATFDRIHKTALDLKAGRLKDAGPQNLASREGLIRRAAEIEAEAMVKEADRAARNAVEGAKVMATRQAEAAAMTGKKTPLGKTVSEVDAVRRLIENDADGVGNQFSLEARYQGIATVLKTKIQSTWLAMDRSFGDYLSGTDKTKLLLREMKGENTGDPIAKAGAKAWLAATEEARLWFNEKGGKIGHLDDWAAPQHHSQERVSRAGAEGWTKDMTEAQKTEHSRNAWVTDTLGWIDHSRYTDLAGNQMSEAEIRQFLGKAWETIATNGVLKDEPGAFKGAGARANRHAEERQIHYKDADSMMAAWEKYGEQTVPSILFGHMDRMAKDIAFLEHFGSNPEATYRVLRDTAMQTAIDKVKANPKQQAKIMGEVSRLDRTFDYASGKSKPVANQAVATGFDVLHNLNTAGKLGSAFWASLIGDKVMFEAISHLNNVPAIQRWRNELALMNPANKAGRDALRRQGLMLDYMTQAMYRFGDELGKSSFTGKLANGVMKVTGMSAVNEWRRGASALGMMDALGSVLSKKDFADLGPQDMRLVKSYGITEGDWKVWKLAELVDLGTSNKHAITPEAIGKITDAELKAANIIAQADSGVEAAAIRRDAVVKLMGAITAESHLAVIEPGWHERAAMYGGLQRGNVRDELMRSFWQFKAFPFAQFEKMVDIGMSRPTAGGKAGVMSAIFGMQILTGAMMLQVQEMLAGKDPRPMWDWKFMAAAFLKGGTLGLYGDFLFSQSATTRYGTGPLEAVAGPTIGAAADIATFIAQAPGQIAQGKEPRTAAKVVNIAKGFVPGQNMWMTKAATDHFLFQNVQEMLNPGYLQSMRNQSLKERGNDWWMPPGPNLPERPPDLGRAFESR